jgi:hypothetical protein
MDCSIDPATTQERSVRRVDYGVERERRDVGVDCSESLHSVSVAA